MDTSSLIIGLGFLLVFILPVLYLVFRQSNQKKKRQKRIMQTANNHSIHPEHIEILSEMSLILDTNSKKLMLLPRKKNTPESIFNLQEYKSFRIVRIYDPEAAEKSLDAVSEIQLELKPLAPEKNIDKIIFFESEKQSVMEKESRWNIAKKWDQLLLETTKK